MRIYFVKVTFYISVINFALIYPSMVKLFSLRMKKIKNKIVMCCPKIKSRIIPRARK